MRTNFLFFGLLALALTSACEKKPQAGNEEPPTVSVMVAKKSQEPVVTELPGRLEAYRQAEVRARAAGIVTKRLYQEGQMVKEGTPLFQIDPAPLKAAHEITEGQVASAKAAHIVAKDKLNRYADLKDEKAVSELEYATAVAEEAQAKATLLSAEAARKNAALNLQYANVTSPIAGRARRAMVTEGALVGLDSPTPLTIVEQTDPIYVNFAQPASEVLALRRASRQGAIQDLPEDSVKVQIVLADGTLYAESGKLLFSDLAVDPKTDTVSMRALFPNKGGELLAGGFVNVKLVRAVNNAAVLVPRDALVRGQDSATVMIVNAEQKVEAVKVKAEELRGTSWVVTEGLKGGERIILANPAMLAPGMPVKALEKEAPAPAETAPPSAQNDTKKAG